MKQALFIIFLLTFSFVSANDTGKVPESIAKETKKENKDSFSNSNVSISELEVLDFSVDAIFKNLTFKSAKSIDYINIYNEDQEQIFSAKGSILITDTLNISFLDTGIYYVEVVVNNTIGSKKISI